MIERKIKAVFFSPSGTTELVTKTVVEALGKQREYHHILEHRLEKKLTISSNEVLVVVMPVFGGRVPSYCLSSLKHLHGEQTPAIIVAVYGNREFDDTLVEIQDILENGQFKIVAGAAFVAQHSIFTQIAGGRPDEEDKADMVDFAAKCKEKLDNFDPQTHETPKIPGNRPYKEYMAHTMAPEGDKNCTKCRTCVKICPVHGINSETPRKTDKKKCMGCTACIAHCPAHARGYSGPVYAVMKKKLMGACSEKKVSKIYI